MSGRVGGQGVGWGAHAAGEVALQVSGGVKALSPWGFAVAAANKTCSNL